MAFIQATWEFNDNKIAINIDHIVAVYPSENHTVIQTHSPAKDVGLQYWVTESYEDILRRMEDAQVYGPRPV